MSAQMDPRQILALPMQPNDADEETVRDYLIALLAKVWDEKECFGGKRPFGNSGWQYELYIPLMIAGLIDGKCDDDGYIEWADCETGDRLIADAIEELRSAK